MRFLLQRGQLHAYCFSGQHWNTGHCRLKRSLSPGRVQICARITFCASTCTDDVRVGIVFYPCGSGALTVRAVVPAESLHLATQRHRPFARVLGVWSDRNRAAARSGYIEATAHFRAAIEEADRLPHKDERARRALTLLLKLGPAIAVTIGEWKPEIEAVYRRARELGREVGDGPQLFRATWSAQTAGTTSNPGSGPKN